MICTSSAVTPWRNGYWKASDSRSKTQRVTSNPDAPLSYSLLLTRYVLAADAVQEAVRFGIPAFVPWPLNSILGFFGIIPVGTLILKVLITTTGAGRLTASK